MSEPILMGLEEFEKLTGVPVNTQKDWRARGKGPRSAVIGGKVKYRRREVLAWIDEQFDTSAKASGSPQAFTPLGRRRTVPRPAISQNVGSRA